MTQMQPVPPGGIEPKTKSVISMTLAVAFHFGGYELARSSVLAMITSHRIGFSNNSAISFATGCIGPFALGLLWLYTRILDKNGPRKALRYSTMACGSIMAVGGVLLSAIDPILDNADKGNMGSIYHQVSKSVLWLMFVLLGGFVQLLYTQHWSFLGSVQSSQEAAVRFAPIAGVGSIVSTIAAFLVSHLVEYVGLTGLLYGGAAGLLLSAFFGDQAYHLAEKHGFEPNNGDKRKSKKQPLGSEHGGSLVAKAQRLFVRVPVLGALSVEVLTCQCLSSLLNFLFVIQVKQSILDDEDRAGWTGNSYACINGASGVLQFFVLPLVVKNIDARRIWLFNPSVMLCCTLFLSMQMASPLHLATAAFLMLKTMEYSIRGLASEMVYVNLDYESRYVGKEIIGVFVNRFGKSGMAIALSLVSVTIGSGPEALHKLSVISNGVAALWLVASFRLYKLLVGDSHQTKEE